MLIFEKVIKINKLLKLKNIILSSILFLISSYYFNYDINNKDAENLILEVRNIMNNPNLPKENKNINIKNSNFIALQNNFVSDKKGEINIFMSNFDGKILKSGNVNIN